MYLTAKKKNSNEILFIPLLEMKLDFYKYHGTGNDFILIDNRDDFFPKKDAKLISQLCDRRLGIGSDGLLLLENHVSLDFTMTYFNADGRLGSMCGNGGRCMVNFANFLGIINKKTVFEAIDGFHEASIDNDVISLKMNDVTVIEIYETHVFLNTGSPHHVELVTKLDAFNVEKEGALIRNNIYGKEGSNINFVEAVDNNTFAVRTYERGVERETYSCGTGVTAVAIALFEMNKTPLNLVTLNTKGGILKVKFIKTDKGYSEVFLEGPAIQVYNGIWK